MTGENEMCTALPSAMLPCSVCGECGANVKDEIPLTLVLCQLTTITTIMVVDNNASFVVTPSCGSVDTEICIINLIRHQKKSRPESLKD